MKEHVSIVTGGNCGIGLETARGLAETGGTVVIATRNTERGHSAVRDIRQSTGNSKVDFIPLDLSSLRSIRVAADAFLRGYTRIDLLVNNAGVISRKRRETEDGFELTFGVNHLGHFLLAQLLEDRIRETAREHGGARVVSVSSVAHRSSKGLDFTDLMYRARQYRWFGAYSDSKLANILFIDALARRLEGTGIVAHAVHPGLVRSRLARRENVGGLVWSAVGALFLLSGISTLQGAQTSLFAATSPEAGRVTGKYWEKSRMASPRLPPGSREMSERLWQVSSELTSSRV